LKKDADYYSYAGCLFPVDDPDIRTPASQRAPYKAHTEKHWHHKIFLYSAESVNPLSFLSIDDPDFATPASKQTPDNIPQERTTYTVL
jgi:hypothetical protein